MALTTSLSFFLSLEEVSGTRFDSTANGQNFTDVNTVTQAAGIVGNAAQFTQANSESLTRASNALLQPAPDFTIQAWVNYVNNDGVIACKDDVGVNRQFNLDMTGGSARIFIFDSIAGNASVQQIISSGAWHHLIFTYDSSDKKGRLYVDNGVANVTSALTNGILTSGTSAFELGNRAASANPYGGLIDQFGFWQRVLTAGEITQLYNGGAGLSYSAMVAMSTSTRYGSSPSIRSLGLITAGATATQLCTDVGLFATVLGFQWVSGTVTIGSSTVTAGGVGAYANLDTTSRVKELRYEDNCAPLPVKDVYCVGSGTFICYYQVH